MKNNENDTIYEENLDFNKMLESIIKQREYIEALRKAVLSFNKDEVKALYLQAVKEKSLYREDNKLSQEEIVNDSKRAISAMVLQEIKKIFVDKKEELNVASSYEYINTLEPVLNKKAIVLALWHIEEKDMVKEFLKNETIEINEKEYDRYMKTIGTYITSLDLLLTSQKPNGFINQETHKQNLKTEFFNLLSYFSLDKKLKNTKSNSIIKKI